MWSIFFLLYTEKYNCCHFWKCSLSALSHLCLLLHHLLPPFPFQQPLTPKQKMTPIRSPLPELRDARLASPCGMFFSPYPSSSAVVGNNDGNEGSSSKPTDDHYKMGATTPTNFAHDYGKITQSSSFDANNGMCRDFMNFATVNLWSYD